MPDTMQPLQTADDTRQLILDTAREHLRRFGLSKLTIVDVAKALGMSHANVYRYFRSKAEILDAIVDEWLARVEALLEPITHEPVSAAERIERVALEIFRRRQQKARVDPEMLRSFRQIISLRPDAVAFRVKRIDEVFEFLIKEGIEQGEFSGIKPRDGAMVLNDALTVFLHPMMDATFLLETSEERLRRLLAVLLSGFRTGASRV